MKAQYYASKTIRVKEREFTPNTFAVIVILKEREREREREEKGTAVSFYVQTLSFNEAPVVYTKGGTKNLFGGSNEKRKRKKAWQVAYLGQKT